MEKKGLERADIILGISDTEANYYRDLVDKSCIWLGHSFEKRFISSKKTIPKKIRYGFIGSKNQVNSENVKEFISELKNHYANEEKNFELIIAGDCCSDLNEFENIKWLNLKGRVDKIDDFYQNIDCVVVPLFFGTGQKIKTIEALSYGMPLLSSSHASLGIGTKSQYHMLDSHEQFSEIMRRIDNDSNLLIQIKKRAA